MNDLIRRQDAIDAIYERIRQIGYENNPLVLSIRQAIRDLPSAQPERKKGKWVLIGSRLASRPYACSECNYAFQVDTVMGKTAWNYCPNCGAQMDERTDDE